MTCLCLGSNTHNTAWKRPSGVRTLTPVGAKLVSRVGAAWHLSACVHSVAAFEAAVPGTLGDPRSVCRAVLLKQSPWHRKSWRREQLLPNTKHMNKLVGITMCSNRMGTFICGGVCVRLGLAPIVIVVRIFVVRRAGTVDGGLAAEGATGDVKGILPR